MLKLFSLLVVVASLAAAVPAPQTTATDPCPMAAAAKRVKASVTGVGKTKYEAENDAERAAREVSGGSYSTVRKNTSGSGSSWTCAMTIEYTEKK